jgi:drug/metabolite transporter (DMT)-like permease
MLVATAVLFSTGGAAVKGIALNSWQIAGTRSLVAALAVLLLLPEARRGWRWRSAPVAVTYAATLLLFVSATKLTTAANAIFLQGAAPLFVLLLNPLLLREPIRRSDLTLMAAVAAGMALVFLGHENARATAPNPALGNLLGAASGLTWAMTITGLRWIGRSAPAQAGTGLATVVLGNLIACAASLPFAFPFPAFHGRDAAIILWLGVFQVGLAYVFLTRGIRSVAAIEATLLLLLEPALNPVWAWLVHGERPAAQSLAGGGVIFLAIGGISWWQNRRSPAL